MRPVLCAAWTARATSRTRRTDGLGGQLAAQLGEALPLDVLHGDVGPALDLADLVDLADVGVLDARLGAGLAQEAPGLLGSLQCRNFRATWRPRVRVEGQEDRAHAAGAEEALDAVARPAGEEAELGGEGDGAGPAGGASTSWARAPGPGHRRGARRRRGATSGSAARSRPGKLEERLDREASRRGDLWPGEPRSRSATASRSSQARRPFEMASLRRRLSVGAFMGSLVCGRARAPPSVRLRNHRRRPGSRAAFRSTKGSTGFTKWWWMPASRERRRSSGWP